jgi:hypothetical protein
MTTGWQPISTAPKDGTWIVAYSGKDARPGTPHGLWCDVVQWAWTTDRDDRDVQAWIDAEGFSRLGVTHWMSLPEPPA